MKTLYWIGLTLVLLGGAATPGAAQGIITLGSTAQAPRAGASNYIDWWQVRTGPTVLYSLFGYNSGPQQWVQLFDTALGKPTLALTFNSAQYGSNFVCLSHGLVIGTRVQLTNTVGGVTAGIYYAAGSATNQFCLYDTLADAQSRTATGVQAPSGSGAGYAQLVPLHTLAVAASDNFSMVVPGTGITFGGGLLIANSTTPVLYTAPGLSNITVTVTLGPIK